VSGCFGNSDEDKYHENQMLEHTDPICKKCGKDLDDECDCED